jgi:hypothetical protein
MSYILTTSEFGQSPVLLDVFPTAPTFIGGAAPGTPAASVAVTYPTATGVGGGRLVGIDNGDVVLIDSSIVATAYLAIGITRGAATPATSVEIITHGPVDDSSWTWNEGLVYAGLNGLLTQTAPSTGFVLNVGKAISPTRIIVNLQQPYLLSP